MTPYPAQENAVDVTGYHNDLSFGLRKRRLQVGGVFKADRIHELDPCP